MHTLQQTINNNSWIGEAIELLADHPIHEVLPMLYPLQQVEQYINSTKAQLAREIISQLSTPQRYNDTNEKVTFDQAFFENILSFSGTIRKFKQHVLSGNLPVELLLQYHQILCKNHLFKAKNRQ